MILNDGELYRVVNTDCITGMATLPERCLAHAIFSPPFPALYSYTSLESDLGNADNFEGDAKLHLSFFMRQLKRVMMPGRVVMLHCQDIVRMKRTGGDGLFDFRGLLIRLGERAGMIYDYTWAVRKGPQAQAIRTRSRALQFQGLENDRSYSRGALPDYLIKFRIPGENKVPIDSEGDVTRNNWIDWAEYCWDDVRETDTLNTAEARGKEDVRHICALQLPVILRSIRLFSNPGEIVFDPFTGIGSTGHEALKLGRRFFGYELKAEYHAAALRNLARAARLKNEEQSMNLFAETVDA